MSDGDGFENNGQHGELSIGKSTYAVHIAKDGFIYGVGSNQYGQVGDGASIDRLKPVLVADVTGVFENGTYTDIELIVGGFYFSMMILDGEVYSLGYNERGQLGDGTTTTRSTLVKKIATDIEGPTITDVDKPVIFLRGSEEPIWTDYFTVTDNIDNIIPVTANM